MTKSKSREIEIKVQVENVKELIKFLKKQGKFIAEEHQVDTYYTPAHRSFTNVRPVAEWLRLRDSSGAFSLNYKFWHRDEEGRSHFCDEFETTINDLKQMEKIFQAVNMTPLVIVDKSRKTWLYGSYEIAIDTVKNLGEFVEIEYKGSSKKTPAEITKEMVNFLKKFNPGKITRDYSGYPFKLLFPNEGKTETY